MPGTQLPRLGITGREGCVVPIGIAQDEWKFDRRHGEAPLVVSSTGGAPSSSPGSFPRLRFSRLSQQGPGAHHAIR
jgi:hypothetical protein